MKNSILILLCFCVAASAASRRSLLMSKKPDATSSPVDSYLDFHLETIGQQLSMTAHQSSYGETNWVYTDLNQQLTNRTYFSNVVGTNITFPVPISVAGNTFASTGTNWIRESFEITNGTAMLLLDITQSSITEVIFYFRFSKLTNSITSQSKDPLRMTDNPFTVAQSSQPVGNDILPTFSIHTGSGTGPSSIFSIPTETIGRLEVVHDGTNNLSYVRVINALTHSVIGAAICNSNGVGTIQSHIQILAGYFSITGNTGVWDRTAFSVNHTSVNTNRPPWVPNAPSLVTVTQTGDGEVTLTVTDNNDLMNYYHVDIWNSGTWTNNITNIVVGTNMVVITGLSGGSNYNFRAYATGPLVTDVPSAKVESGAITLTSTVWYDSISYASTDSSIDQNLTFVNYGATVNVSSGGTATKLRVGLGAIVFGSVGFKIALYDSSSNLVASATSTTGASSDVQREVSITPTVISAGTYYVVWIANSGAGGVFYKSKSGTSGSGIYIVDYSAFPPSVLGPPDGGTTETISAGVFVQ